MRAMTNLIDLASSDELHIVYITALEMPSLSNLHASQVLAPACQLARQGYRVTWVAVIPHVMRMKDIICSTHRLRQVSEACSEHGIDFFPFYVPLISNVSLASFCFRKTILRRVAKKIFSTLRWSKFNLLQARSYYAAEISLHLREMMPLNGACKVSFDMRSIFPEEIPLISPSCMGVMTFGFMKQWEFELLQNSDIAILPLHYARNRIYNETGIRVRYLPVQGFDREPGWKVDFEKRWKDSRLGYSGSIGAWHSPEILLHIFQALPWANPRLAMKPHPLFLQYDCRVYKNNDMPLYYDELLGLVIPGRHDPESYFMNFKIRCNFFSTKAAEALSRGVPLVVSSKLFELAKFVRKKRCGFIYDPDSKQFVFPGMNSIAKRDVWEEMTSNAVAVGEKFTRAYVVNQYLACWKSLFEKDAARS